MSAASNDLEKLESTTAMNWLDKLSCLGVLGGTTASLFVQQAAVATVPLSILLTLQIFSRQQKVTALVTACQKTSESVQMVSDDLNRVSQQCQERFQAHDQNFETLAQVNNQHDLEFITIKEMFEDHSKTLTDHAELFNTLEETLASLKEITASSGSVNQAASATAHFTRGTHQEKLGHLEVAIDDYSQAIEQSQDYAEAYLRRGLAKSKLGRKQSAVIDLNLATKHFFESGDLANYQRAKDIAANIHKVSQGEDLEQGAAEMDAQADQSSDRKSELVTVNGLFGS